MEERVIMNNEIKEILDYLKIENGTIGSELSYEETHLLLDYITNLQEQLHQASLDIQELTERDIECPSWCDKLTNLQQENERLKIDNKILKQNNINEVLRNDFDMCVKDLKKANKKIEKLEKYKSRIEKAVEYINKHKKEITKEDTSIFNEDRQDKSKLKVGTFMWNVDELIDILNGSDE